MKQRYTVEQFDSDTFIVADMQLNREVCICGAYDGGEAVVDGFSGRTPEEARHAAYRIADLLNANEAPRRTLVPDAEMLAMRMYKALGFDADQ